MLCKGVVDFYFVTVIELASSGSESSLSEVHIRRGWSELVLYSTASNPRYIHINGRDT
ncbi:hypothetical protein M758_10G159200 [Ceratodon purpureus]|uniref:Uncharacterized protein n=1 Tax=Ceratodon purpureus TaxID=3225 RepID=A0A8T0GL01_CERPU|nr:hypothetical protein KC19_10G164000 [Ceratodon purpureus]KAG0604280.1 hypothetical protein M758_10G159200 [Ceratodon purpureus]